MRKLAALMLLTGLYACNNQKTDKVIDSTAKTVTGSSTDTLSYTYDSVKVYSKTPVSVNKNVTDTAKAVVSYPQFADETANKFVQEKVIGLAGKQGAYKNYKELANSFIQEYDNFKSKNADSPESWFENLDLKVTANYPDYLSVLFTYIDYRGGAHPNTLFTYVNYNPKNNQTLTLDSVITTEGMPVLRQVAEKIFRNNEKLGPNASLSEGYFFAEGKFALAQTFTLTKEGLKFLYNPYEIKAYAAGTTELIVPYSAIKDILKPTPILSNFK